MQRSSCDGVGADSVTKINTSTNIATTGINGGDHSLFGIAIPPAFAPPPPPPPPIPPVLTLKAAADKDIRQADIFNILHWTIKSGFTPVGFSIFRNGCLLTTVSPSTFYYEDHNLKAGKIYTYTVIEEVSSGEPQEIGTASVKSKKG